MGNSGKMFFNRAECDEFLKTVKKDAPRFAIFDNREDANLWLAHASLAQNLYAASDDVILEENSIKAVLQLRLTMQLHRACIDSGVVKSFHLFK